MNQLSIRRFFSFFSLLRKWDLKFGSTRLRRPNVGNLEGGGARLWGGAFIGIAFDLFHEPFTNPIGKDPLYVDAFALKRLCFILSLFPPPPRAFYVRAAQNNMLEACASSNFDRSPKPPRLPPRVSL